MDARDSAVSSSTDAATTAFAIFRALAYRKYPKELFQDIIDYCREGIKDLNLAVDVGCGEGKSTFGFTQDFKQVIGVDINEAILARAPKVFLNCQFKVGCGTKMDFIETGSVDLYVSGMAHHFMPQKGMLDEADRVLRPGGTLAIFFYNLPWCTNKRMNEYVQWLFNYVAPTGVKEMVAAVELQKELVELSYSNWIRKQTIVLSEKITPKSILSGGQPTERDPVGEKEIEERMAEALSDIRDDPEANSELFEFKYPIVVLTGRKPVNK